MTLKQYAKKNKINAEHPFLGACNTYDIDFTNSDGEVDETQFNAKDINELDELYTDFCKENGFKRNTVISITIVAPN